MSLAGKDIDYTDIKSLLDIKELYVYLKNEDHPFETLVIDSISEINEIIKAEMEKTKGHTLQIQDWGELAKILTSSFRMFRDLPMHVIMIAQEKYVTDDAKIQKIMPSLNGRAAETIPYFMDIVGYLHINDEGERQMITSPNKKLVTKDRTGLLGSATSADFSDWIDKISELEIEEEIEEEKENSGVIGIAVATKQPPAVKAIVSKKKANERAEKEVEDAKTSMDKRNGEKPKPKEKTAKEKAEEKIDAKTRAKVFAEWQKLCKFRGYAPEQSKDERHKAMEILLGKNSLTKLTNAEGKEFLEQIKEWIQVENLAKEPEEEAK